MFRIRVTHPSATQSPDLPPKIPIRCFVRLACVRHAASVHPEPGSNSLKIVLSQTFVCYNQFPDYLACCYFYTGFTAPGGLLSITSKEFQVCNSFKFTLFNLQGTMLFRCQPFSRAAYLVYHLISDLSRTFFISFFKLDSIVSLISQRQLIQFNTFIPFCQALFCLPASNLNKSFGFRCRSR